ncbi:MAG: hypothetical protein EBZ91_08375 [Gammaproteobacteria bacterium]|nr:hypothetical protein [Gammaproteobacteria bacterium]
MMPTPKPLDRLPYDLLLQGQTLDLYVTNFRGASLALGRMFHASMVDLITQDGCQGQNPYPPK